MFYYFCIKHQPKLSAEHNKDPAYVSTGYRNWKKTPKCFKEYEQSKCHTAALPYEVVLPKCADVAEMHNNELIKQRKMEGQYLKIIMESLQYLGRQGIPLRGKEEGNDNFTQLLLLRGKDHPFIIERLTSTREHGSLYVHHNYQNDLINIMSKQLLRKKLYDINRSRMFSLMCDEYTDVSNKQQLSMCVRWIDDSLNPHEDFLGFYELPNIASDTIVSAIKDSLILFNLPLSGLRGQTYDNASIMLGKRSGVAAQIKRVQPKAIETLPQKLTKSIGKRCYKVKQIDK